MARRLARSQESRRALADVGRKYPVILRGSALITVNARGVRGWRRWAPFIMQISLIFDADALYPFKSRGFGAEIGVDPSSFFRGY